MNVVDGGVAWWDRREEAVTEAVTFLGYEVCGFFVLYLLNNGNSLGELRLSHNMGYRTIIHSHATLHNILPSTTLYH